MTLHVTRASDAFSAILCFCVLFKNTTLFNLIFVNTIFVVLQFHVLHSHASNLMSCHLVCQFHVLHFHVRHFSAPSLGGGSFVVKVEINLKPNIS